MRKHGLLWSCPFVQESCPLRVIVVSWRSAGRRIRLCLLVALFLGLENHVKVFHQRVVKPAAVGDQILNNHLQLQAAISVKLKEHSSGLAKMRVGAHQSNQLSTMRDVRFEKIYLQTGAN